MSKPSVIFVNRVYPPVRGASGRVLRDLARAFARDGWQVTVISAGPVAKKELDGPVRVIRVKAPVRARRFWAYARVWVKLLGALLIHRRADLIITMTDPPLLVSAGRIAARFKRSRHMHWCQDLYPDLLPHLGMKLPHSIFGLFKRISRRALRSCDKVVVIGRCMARQLTHSGLDPRRVAVIPNWPDAELLGPGRAGRRTGKRAMHIVTNAQGARPYEEQRKEELEAKFRILYSGNLGRAHPVQSVLEAAEILNGTYPEIEFVFVGDGPGFDWLARERARRGLENLRLMPYQPVSRLREIMESGDMHLITMMDEVEGLLVPCKLYSALAVERPCILVGPEDSETGKVIRDFRAGAIVPQGDAARLAETIKRFRYNGDQWFRAQEGAAQAGQVFVPQESISAWIKRARDVVQLPAPRKGRWYKAQADNQNNDVASNAECRTRQKQKDRRVA